MNINSSYPRRQATSRPQNAKANASDSALVGTPSETFSRSQPDLTAATPAFSAPAQVGQTEIKKALEKSTFQVADMQKLLDGEQAEARGKAREILAAPMFSHVEGLSKDDYREQVMQWCKELARNEMGSLAFPKEFGGKGDMAANIAAFETMAHFDLSLVIKFGVQMGLWGGSVYNLGTQKHHEKLLPGIMSLETPGCFAMTETGHGSNVAGLETVARYDKESDELVITSTTPGARKDYIGGAAKHARFASVFSQLEVDGENQGVHAVIVPIRDEEGNPLPGVTISDCGEKKGLNGVDNGRLSFQNVRVPRENLLDKYGGIDENGVYSSPIEDKNKRFFTQIGTLITGRVSIAAASNSVAKNGLAIALRYAEQRRQFGQPGEPEQKLLDYQAHQRRLLPELAKTYALDFAVKDLVDQYVDVNDENRREVGELAGALKAYASRHAIDTLQECREACGGQGYLHENRFASMQEDVDIFATFEGDNTILKQMVAKGALDQLKGKGPLGMAMKWVSDKIEFGWEKNPIRKRRTGEGHLKGSEFHRDAFEYREETAVMKAGKKFRQLLKQGHSKKDAVNLCQQEFLDAGQAVTERVVLESFLGRVESCQDESLKPVLNQLADLYALSTVEENKGWFLENGYFSGRKAKAISEEVTELCAEIRPDAVALVESFGISEKSLGAPIAFGRVPA